MLQDPLDGWLAESIRLSFLDIPGWTQRPIFGEVAGVEPTSTSVERMVQTQQEAGDVSHAFLNVMQQSNRIDIVLGDKPSQNTVDPLTPGYKPFFVGPFRQTLEMFDAVADKAVNLVSGAIRVAYAITLIRPTSDAQEAVRALHRLIPSVPVDPEKDSDLIFQINRPARDDQGRVINRLARWQALQVATVRMRALGVPMPILPSAPLATAAQIYIDTSTDASNIVPISDLPRVVSELREHSVKLAEGEKAK